MKSQAAESNENFSAISAHFHYDGFEFEVILYKWKQFDPSTLSAVFRLAEQVTDAADKAALFKTECAEVKTKTEELAALLWAAPDSDSNSRKRIFDNTKQVLEMALALVLKCNTGGIVMRVLTIIPAEEFQKVKSQLCDSIKDVMWLNHFSASLKKISDNDRSFAAAKMVSLRMYENRYGKLIFKEMLKLLSEGGMEISLVKRLFHISSPQNMESDLVRKYYKKTEEILELLSPILYGIVGAEMEFHVLFQRAFARLDYAVDDIRKLRQLSGCRVYFVLQAEALILGVRNCCLEIVELLVSCNRRLPAEPSLESLNNCAQKLKSIDCELLSRSIAIASRDCVEGAEGFVAIPDSLKNIASCLCLNSRHEFLFELEALEKLKENAAQTGKSEEFQFIEQVIAVVTCMLNSFDVSDLMESSEECSSEAEIHGFCSDAEMMSLRSCEDGSAKLDDTCSNSPSFHSMQESFQTTRSGTNHRSHGSASYLGSPGNSILSSLIQREGSSPYHSSLRSEKSYPGPALHGLEWDFERISVKSSEGHLANIEDKTSMNPFRFYPMQLFMDSLSSGFEAFLRDHDIATYASPDSNPSLGSARRSSVQSHLRSSSEASFHERVSLQSSKDWQASSRNRSVHLVSHSSLSLSTTILSSAEDSSHLASNKLPNLHFSTLFGFLTTNWRKEKNRGSSKLSRIEISRISYSRLHRATNGFSRKNLIGAGSFGSIYKGTMEKGGGQTFAVKVLDLKKNGASKSFVAECKVSTNIRHRNIVPILTCCSSVGGSPGNEFKALVYKFMENRDLDMWLHAHPDPWSKVLSVLRRLNIAIDVASALCYLHHDCVPSVVHCDIKPRNILLNNDLTAHVGDFGLSGFDPLIIETLSAEQAGYIPPEYGIGANATTSGDVYSYGILLLEMFTGIRPTGEEFIDGCTSLNEYVEKAIPEQVMTIVDPSLLAGLESNGMRLDENMDSHGNSVRVQEIKTQGFFLSIFKIGLSCASESPTDRLTMREVSRELHKIKKAFFV